MYAFYSIDRGGNICLYRGGMTYRSTLVTEKDINSHSYGASTKKVAKFGYVDSQKPATAKS